MEEVTPKTDLGFQLDRNLASSFITRVAYPRE